MYFSPTKIMKMFSTQKKPAYNTSALNSAVEQSRIPSFPHSTRKSWDLEQVPLIGEQFGFIKKPSQPKVVYVFVTKGGVLKSTLTLNLARLVALHNIKTCVVGLDMQSDVTTALGFNNSFDESEHFDKVIGTMSKIKGLPEVFHKKSSLEEVIQNTDIPTLKFIPETPELVAMERALSLNNNREHWLNQCVVTPLKESFDLIILDGSPNWNLLTTNALTATDLLLSPLECKINNFRNFKMFESFIREFKWDMNLCFEHQYVPTRLNKQRKLSNEIHQWYVKNLNNCSKYYISESAQGEEATAMNLSISEYAPGSPLSLSLNNLLKEVMNLVDRKNQVEIADQRSQTDQEEVARGINA